MHLNYANRFACPDCRTALQPEIFTAQGEQALEGVFVCPQCNSLYPLRKGIPRLLSPATLIRLLDREDVTHYVDTFAERLSADWVCRIRSLLANPNAETTRPESANFYAFQWTQYNTPYDVNDAAELRRLVGDPETVFAHCRNERVLDIGGGQGRYTRALLDTGAREVTCMDLGLAIELAYSKYKDDPRVLCVQGDIFSPPFAEQYHAVVCIGVLQHLPDPHTALRKLLDLVRPGGRLTLWCYGNSSAKRSLTALRRTLQGLPVRVLWHVAGTLALGRYAVSKFSRLLSRLGLSGIANRLPWQSYRGYPFAYFHVNTFDHCSTPIIHFFQRSELEEMMQEIHPRSWSLEERFPGCANASWLLQAEKE